MFRIKTICALLLLVLCFPALDALACSCLQNESVFDEYNRSKIVAQIKVVSFEKVEGNDWNYIKSTQTVVEKVYKGKIRVGDELIFEQSGSGCARSFDEESLGEKFLVYLNEPIKPRSDDEQTPTGSLEEKPVYPSLSICGRSNTVAEAADDLLYLDKLDKVRGKTRVSGRIKTIQKNAPGFSGLKIKITGKNKVYETRTDKNGVYEIYDLPPGEYLLEPQVPKGWKAFGLATKDSTDFRRADELRLKNQTAFLLKEKSHTGVDLLFDIDNAIRGKIISPIGQPLKDIRVDAISTETTDLNEWNRNYAETDEEGEFEIESLAPGNYILVVNKAGKANAGTPVGTLYYPGVAERERAGILSVNIGKFVENVIIQIPKLEEVIEISGVFEYSDGKPVAAESILFLPTDETDDFDDETVWTQTDENGRFTIRILKGSAGEVKGKIYFREFEDCPELQKKVQAAAGEKSFVYSNSFRIEAAADVSDIKLIFPFPSCSKNLD